MLWLGIVGFFLPFMIGGTLTIVSIKFGLPGLVLQVGIILTFVFIAIMGAARQWEKKQRAQVVLGIASSITQPTRISSSARSIGLRPVVFTRTLSELITYQVIDVEIYPIYDAFGPPGIPPTDMPADHYGFTEVVMHSSGWATPIRWIGIFGTVLSIIVSALYLIQFILTFFGH